jgi:hypothetical protein
MAEFVTITATYRQAQEKTLTPDDSIVVAGHVFPAGESVTLTMPNDHFVTQIQACQDLDVTVEETE